MIEEVNVPECEGGIVTEMRINSEGHITSLTVVTPFHTVGFPNGMHADELILKVIDDKPGPKVGSAEELRMRKLKVQGTGVPGES